MTKKEFIELAEKHLTALEGYEIDKNGGLELKIFGFKKLYEAINFTDSCTELKDKEVKNIEDIDTIFLDTDGVEKILLNKFIMTVDQYKLFVNNTDEKQP